MFQKHFDTYIKIQTHYDMFQCDEMSVCRCYIPNYSNIWGEQSRFVSVTFINV